MKLAAIALFAIATQVVGCSMGLVDRGALKIQAFRQGLLQVGGGTSRFSALGNDFVYSHNGTCIADGKTFECMWHGFEIKYEPQNIPTELLCTTRASHPVDRVDPKATRGRSVVSTDWKLSLNSSTGVILNAQYTIWGDPDLPSEPLRSTTICTHLGKKVLDFEFTVRPPRGDA